MTHINFFSNIVPHFKFKIYVIYYPNISSMILGPLYVIQYISYTYTYTFILYVLFDLYPILYLSSYHVMFAYICHQIFYSINILSYLMYYISCLSLGNLIILESLSGQKHIFSLFYGFDKTFEIKTHLSQLWHYSYVKNISFYNDMEVI